MTSLLLGAHVSDKYFILKKLKNGNGIEINGLVRE